LSLKKILGLFASLLVVFAGLLPPNATANAAANPTSTVKKLALIESAGLGLNTPAESSLVVLPNESIISFQHDENRTTFSANLVSADGKKSTKTEIYNSRNSSDWHANGFDWIVNQSGKLTVVYAKWTRESGKLFSGVSARSTTNGTTWSSEVSVLPAYELSLGCNAVHEVCGYIQPHLQQSADGKLIVVAAKTELKVAGQGISSGNLIASTSSDATIWSASTSIAPLPDFGGTPSETKAAYSGKGLFSVAATDSEFIVLYPYLTNHANIWLPPDVGFRTSSLPFADLQNWQDPKVVHNVSGLTWANDGGTLHMGPFLVKTSNKLLALWFEKPSNGNLSILRGSTWDPVEKAWDARKDLYSCTNCWFYNTAPSDRNAYVASGATLTLPFVQYQGKTRQVKFLTIVDGVATNGPDATTIITADQNLSGGASFYGVHLGSDNVLTFVVEANFVAHVVEVSADRKTQVMKRIDQFWQNGLGGEKVVYSYQLPNGNLSLMTQQYRFDGNPTGNILSYYQLIRATPPVFSGKFAVTGTAKVASTIKVAKPTATSPYGAKSVTLKWLRCTKQLKSAPKTKPSYCVAIPNAVSTSYKLTSKDKGKYLIASAESSNSGGVAAIFTASTSIVK
jgi:hypothetical protein